MWRSGKPTVAHICMRICKIIAHLWFIPPPAESNLLGRNFQRLAMCEVSSRATYVNVMDLTATANKATRRIVCWSLGMRNLEVILQSPNKANIKYIFRMKGDMVADMLAPLGKKVKRKRKAMHASHNYICQIIWSLWRRIHLRSSTIILVKR